MTLVAEPPSFGWRYVCRDCGAVNINKVGEPPTLIKECISCGGMMDLVEP